MSRKITTAWEDENIICKFEDLDGFRFLHVEVIHLSKQLIKEWRKHTLDIRKKCIEDGYASLHTYTQNKKFVKMLSKEFKEIAVITFDGKIYEVLKWELKQQLQ